MTTDTILAGEVATNRTPIQRCGGLIIGPQPWEHVGAAQPSPSWSLCSRLRRSTSSIEPEKSSGRSSGPWCWRLCCSQLSAYSSAVCLCPAPQRRQSCSLFPYTPPPPAIVPCGQGNAEQPQP